MPGIAPVRPLPPLVADRTSDQDRAAVRPRGGRARRPTRPFPVGRAARPSRAPDRVPQRGGALAGRRRRGGRGRRRRRRWYPRDPGTARTSVVGPSSAGPAGRRRPQLRRPVDHGGALGQPGQGRGPGTLPPPPAGELYELWLQRPDGTMAKAGRDSTSPSSGTLPCRARRDATGAGITSTGRRLGRTHHHPLASSRLLSAATPSASGSAPAAAPRGPRLLMFHQPGVGAAAAAASGR